MQDLTLSWAPIKGELGGQEKSLVPVSLCDM
jgi:hypothetical protein